MSPLKPLFKIAAWAAVLFLAACAHGTRDRRERIIDATSSIVLDGGSYDVTLFFAPDRHALPLFVANPTRRTGPGQSVRLVGKKGEIKEVLRQDSPLAKSLRQQLQVAQSDPKVDSETKIICRMLERLLIDPNMPYDAVHFPEKWNIP